LAAVALLAIAFLSGLAGVVYMSLQGSEVQVPDITGKDFTDSERELALLGLKIKKRADRPSQEKPNSVIEQVPKAGEILKTGQMVFVVTSKPSEGDVAPPTLKKSTEEDDTEKIEEMISDKPKKPKANSNTNRKKPDTTRDVTANNSDTNSGSNSNSAPTNSNKKDPGTSNNSGDKSNKNTSAPANRTSNPTKPGGAESRPKPPQKP
jgi:hypothetical protein